MLSANSHCFLIKSDSLQNGDKQSLFQRGRACGLALELLNLLTCGVISSWLITQNQDVATQHQHLRFRCRKIQFHVLCHKCKVSLFLSLWLWSKHSQVDECSINTGLKVLRLLCSTHSPWTSIINSLLWFEMVGWLADWLTDMQKTKRSENSCFPKKTADSFFPMSPLTFFF